MFYDHCLRALSESSGDSKLTWATIRMRMGSLIHKITQMKFRDPAEPKEDTEVYFRHLQREIETQFQALSE